MWRRGQDGESSGLDCDCIGGGPAPHICCACDFQTIKNSKPLSALHTPQERNIADRLAGHWVSLLKNYTLHHGDRREDTQHFEKYFVLTHDGMVFRDVFLYDVLRQALQHDLRNY